jgi:4-hydroxy-4-methyl-2-oxoglutarate aldolase
MDRVEIVNSFREELYVALLSDVLDELGRTEQALPAHIRPVDPKRRLAGFARTGLYRDVYAADPTRNPYELEIALVDDLKSNDIAIFACGTSGRIGPWGELLSTAAMARGASGCVTDGLIRDVLAIKEMGFPVFHAGISPRDSKGRGIVAEIDVPVVLGNTVVRPGDFVAGDADGVVVVPSELVEQVVHAALQKARGEKSTRQELLEGAKLKDVFKKYGIL